MKISAFILFLVVLGFWNKFCNGDTKNVISFGLLSDMGSLEGEVFGSCITNAISDFYSLNSQYETRIALHVRDSRGDPVHSITCVLDLLENVLVDAIIIPRIGTKDYVLDRLLDKASVPLLSFSSMPSVDEYPYLLQVGEDEATEFHVISALIKAFRWRSCAILYDDTVDPMQVQHYLDDSVLVKNHIDVVHQEAISARATDSQLIRGLRRIVARKAAVVIVHVSPTLASELFKKAKVFGMMGKGYAWIVTSKAMNSMEYQNSSVYESMQGVIGLKSYVSKSSSLQNFSVKSRTDFHPVQCKFKIRDKLDVYGAWAYDSVRVLAEAIERTGITKHNGHRVQCNLLNSSCVWVSNRGQSLLNHISSSKFLGLAGPFQLMNRKIIRDSYEIVNVIGKGERRVGFWTSSLGLTKDMYPSENSPPNGTLETIIWPGISTAVPPSRLLQINGNSLRVVIPASKFPELVHSHYDPQTNLTTADGFCVEVFRAALDFLKLNISLEFITWFNGTYSDLVYQVSLQTYDAAVGDITILSNRSEYVDFSLPYTDMGVGVVAKLDKKDPWFFIKPIDPGLWITSACLFVLMGVVVWLIERYSEDNEQFKGSWAQQVGTILWFAASTVVYAHRVKLKSNLSKFVLSVWLFVVLILTSSYVANLSSLLTVQQFRLTKSDNIGYLAGSYVRFIANNLNFGDDRLRPYQSPEEYDDALRRGSRHSGVDAILDEIPYSKIFLAKYPQDYTMIKTSMTTNGFGFVFPKGSLLVHEVSRAIVGLRERGILLELEKKWFANESPLLPQDTQPPAIKTLSAYNFFGLFLVNGICEFIALLIFLGFLLRSRFASIHSTFRMWAIQRVIGMQRGLPLGMHNMIAGQG